MSRPPATSDARKARWWKEIGDLDALWNMYDDLCTASLEKETAEGDKEAEVFNAKCVDISAKRNALHAQIRELVNKEIERLEKFKENAKTLKTPEEKQPLVGNSRRKRRFSRKSNGRPRKTAKGFKRRHPR